METSGKLGERWLAHAHYGGEGSGWIWAGLRMRAYNIISASVNLLPIQADFVTERDTRVALALTRGFSWVNISWFASRPRKNHENITPRKIPAIRYIPDPLSLWGWGLGTRLYWSATIAVECTSC